MKSKMFVICSSVAALHLVIGGAVMLGGCTGVQEDEPMPMGAYVPRQPKAKPEIPAVQPEAQTPETAEANPETVIVEPEPAPAPVVPEEKPEVKPVEKGQPAAAPQKGDSPAKTKKPLRANDIQYTIQKGDSYWKIARKFGVATNDLVAYNTIPPAKLRPGQKIMIPASGKKITKPAAVKKTVVKVKKTYAPIPADGIYVVQKGDSYDKIARKFGLRAKDIAEYNNLSLNKYLQVNQKLKLPPRSGAAAQPAAPAQPAVTEAAPIPVDPAGPAAPTTNTTPPEITAPDVPAAIPAPVIPAQPDAPAATATEAPATEASAAPAAAPAASLPASSANTAMTSETISEDTTLAALAKAYDFTEAEIRAKNPWIPADGTIKKGSTILFP